MYRLELDDEEVRLPEYLLLNQRMQLCEMLIELNPDYFTYELPPSKYTGIHSSDRVERRLSILGEYIYDASPCEESSSVVTRYKKSRNVKREVPFSALERTNLN